MKTTYNLLILLISSVLFDACSGNNTMETATETAEEVNIVSLTPEQYQMADIRTDIVKERPLSNMIKSNGLLDVPPQNKVIIATPFAGSVKQTSLLQGMKVEKGQVVAIIEHPDFIQFQQDYLDLKSQLDYLKLEYERQEELAKENINAKKTLQKAKSDYESVNARVMGLQTKLEMMNINMKSLEKGEMQSSIRLFSPISGYVTAVHAKVGAYVDPTTALFEITNTDHLHVELTVFEKDIPNVKIGQKVRFRLSNEKQDRTATIYLISKKISEERTIMVHCHLDKEDASLLPGTYLTAFIEAGGNEVPALPDEAFVTYRGSDYVYLLKNENDKEHVYEMLEVSPGVSESGYTEIIFPEGYNWRDAEFVINGAYDLLSKMKNNEEE